MTNLTKLEKIVFRAGIAAVTLGATMAEIAQRHNLSYTLEDTGALLVIAGLFPTWYGVFKHLEQDSSGYSQRRHTLR